MQRRNRMSALIDAWSSNKSSSPQQRATGALGAANMYGNKTSSKVVLRPENPNTRSVRLPPGSPVAPVAIPDRNQVVDTFTIVMDLQELDPSSDTKDFYLFDVHGWYAAYNPTVVTAPTQGTLYINDKDANTYQATIQKICKGDLFLIGMTARAFERPAGAVISAEQQLSKEILTGTNDSNKFGGWSRIKMNEKYNPEQQHRDMVTHAFTDRQGLITENDVWKVSVYHGMRLELTVQVGAFVG